MQSDTQLRQIDRSHVWHPYSNIDQILSQDFPLIERAAGCYIYDRSGNKFLDGIASWWCINFGHAHPALLKAIREQSEKLQNVILAGMSHENVILLAQKLVDIAPKKVATEDSHQSSQGAGKELSPLQHCYFASDGASAVEAALRIALHYWENLGQPQRKKFFCLTDAYHGDTMGAVSVGYVEKFHQQLRGLLPENFRALSPHCAACPFGKHPDSCQVECFASMAELFAQHAKECAAVIVEPLCQGAGGIRLYPEAYLQKLRTLCDAHQVLLICDEIAVGFGRSGYMFASERAGIVPDLMTVGKGITGGYLPMSAVLASSEIYHSFRPSRGGTTFFHGHTYCGNPIISALALRTLDLYSEEHILEHIRPLILLMNQGIKELQCEFLPQSYSSAKGMIAAIEISTAEGGAGRAAQVAQGAWQRGLFLRPLGNVLYLWPPLIIRAEELQFCFRVLRQCLSHQA